MRDSCISYHYRKAVALAVRKVESDARKILRRHPELKEFAMGMGRAIFIEVQGDISYANADDDPRWRSLMDFIRKWDAYLKITNHSVRFKALGPKTRDW